MSNDHEILMHRDAHFGGNFEIMLEYYRRGGKGTSPDIEIEEIEALQNVEEQAKQNLSDILLSDQEKNAVFLAKKKYRLLRDIYETHTPSHLSLLIADLILSEEENPSSEISALVSKGKEAVSALIELLSSDDFYDPLFPGYGEAPALAARCLGLIGDPKALIPLFEAMGKQGDFFTDEAIAAAFKCLGEPAKDFLMKLLTRFPINKDNEHAAIALLNFGEDPEVAPACFKMLQDPQVLKIPSFAIYLTLACSALASKEEKEQFERLAKQPDLPREIRQEMQEILTQWKK